MNKQNEEVLLGNSQDINTGGGAYIGGNITVSGGDFVGRDQIYISGDGNVIGDHSSATVVKQNAFNLSRDNFLQLLDRLARVVSYANIDPEIAEAVDSALQSAEIQAQKTEPNARLLLMHLRNVVDLLVTVDGALNVRERLLPLAQQALAWGKQLFG
jgi:hypothetical protein